jgi:DNA-binding Lrp family transcriptional regulator
MLMAKPEHILRVVREAGRSWRTQLALWARKVAAGKGRARDVRTTDRQDGDAIGRSRSTVWRGHHELEKRGVLERTAIGRRRTMHAKATPSRWRVAWFGRVERAAKRARKLAAGDHKTPIGRVLDQLAQVQKECGLFSY